jgi:transcriptional regulator with XRE-family HTH domain
LEAVVKSSDSFPIALGRLLEEQGVTQAELTRRTIRLGEKEQRSQAAISRILAGTLKPSVAMMELLARCLDVEPDYFAEYRLWLAGRQLEPTVVGMEAALQNAGRLLK